MLTGAESSAAILEAVRSGFVDRRDLTFYGAARVVGVDTETVRRWLRVWPLERAARVIPHDSLPTLARYAGVIG